MTDRSDPWTQANFNLDQVLSQFPDDQLAELGVTRDMDRDEVLARIKGEAVAQWKDTEENIEAVVAQAIAAIDMYPNDRDQAMARFYGESMQDIGPDEIDSEQILMIMMMCLFKLAEERVKAAWHMDGVRRVTPKK